MIRNYHWFANCDECDIAVAVIGVDNQRIADPSDEDLCEEPFWALDCPYCGHGLVGWSDDGKYDPRVPTTPAELGVES